MINHPKEPLRRTLGILEGTPHFEQPVHIGRPNMGDRVQFLENLTAILDRRWFTNDGPLVREFEQKIADYIEVKHCIAMCNATTALEIVARALELKGEVILPSFTFVATAHALHWHGITPVFADVDLLTYNIDPNVIERLIRPQTCAIIGVHVWGRPCDTDTIEQIAQKYGLPVIYDAAHAFGCSHQGRMIGNFGQCEVFSFHATKFLNSFEGGAVVTNNDELANRVRLMRNFGFAGYDRVVCPGINAKMTEVCAAMGLASLSAIDRLIKQNKMNWQVYREQLHSVPGLHVIQYNEFESCNFQYVVVEVDPQLSTLTRDELVEVLHADNILARKYFSPGVHAMEPYRSLQPNASQGLPQTNRLAASVMVLPTGETINRATITLICAIIREALARANEVRLVLGAVHNQ